MKTDIGILAGLALVTFTGIFTAMLALGVISPLGVQGADQPVDDNGQAVDFQPAMVTDVSVTSTTQGPGDVSGYGFRFTTPDALTANEDAITVHFDKDFGYPPEVLSRSNVTVSAMVSSGSATTDASGPGATGDYGPPSDATREILTSGKHGLSDPAALDNVEYTFHVPDMNGDNEGSPGIAAGATVTVFVSPGAGISNPTEAGSKGPIGVFTSRQPVMDTSLRITVNRTIQLSNYDTHRGKALTVIGRGFQDGSTAAVYLVKTDPGCDFDPDNIPDGSTELVAEPVASDDTFQATFTVTVPPFAPGFGNCIYASDGNQPPFSAGPVEFELEGLLTVSPASAAVGDEVDITLVDWPDGPIPANAVTIAGVTQRIIGSPSVTGNSASFRIEIGTSTPYGINEIRVTANGESDRKRITITDTFSPDPGSVAADRAALAALYNATGGANWTNSSGWLTDAPLYQWYGVEAGANGRVMLLYLDSNQLSGEIPAELGNLTSLEALFLSDNRLSGEMPEALGSLTNLHTLELNGNQLTGPIPAELGSLTNLQILQLNGNQLTGPIPAELGSLTNLHTLWLNSNQLTGPIPAELGNLPYLTGLFLNHNQLIGEIPAELGNLTNLEYLYLGSNRLTGCVPASLRRAANNDLAELGLPFCAMPGPGIVAGDRAALVALYNATDGANWRENSGWLTDAPLGEWDGVETDSTGRVTWLNLDWNQLSGKIPAELGNLTNLEFLSLNVNQLGGEIPEELGNLTNLANLSLEANRLSGDIPAGLGSMTNLTWLYLINNQLSGEIPEELGSLSNLQTLDLNGNRLTGPIPAELGNLTKLIRLYLHGNQLSGEIPAGLGSMTNLTELDFSENPLIGEIPAELGNLTNLRLLRFKGNQLSGEIPAELGKLKSLDTLFLSHNRLSGPIPAALGRLPNLAGLFLNDNQLSGEIPAELGSLPNLAGLFLNHNQLSGEIPAELGNLTNLEYLYLGSNRLTGCVPASLRRAANHDLAELGLPFCDMLDGSPVVVVRFVSSADAPVRLSSQISLEATFSEPVSGFALEDVGVANGIAGNFAGSGAVYTFDVTPEAIGEVTVSIAAGVAEDADAKGNIAARLSLGIPYDDDGDGAISRSEVIAAINDYLFGNRSIAKSHLIYLINLYLFGGTP